MLYRSDKQGRPIIQALILRNWDKDNENFLKTLGGIDEKGHRNEERIRLIQNTIESLRLGIQDQQTDNDLNESNTFEYILDEHNQAGLPLLEPCSVNHYELCDRFV